MGKCNWCGKGPQFGQNRPFSLKATNRRFNVNVQPVTLYNGSQKVRVKLCTRCMRTLVKTK
ncbi:50S ribosomal protein L28 [bacterium]|nr:50S ribosomal protein L28 [Chloroflexi bacterium CFX6]RIL11859.1 MAG: 50S ribosomal protein L28 [bacterium]